MVGEALTEIRVGHSPAADFLAWVQSGQTTPFSGDVILVAAHPDDEIIGAGTLLPHLAALTLVHTTDGSPRNLADAIAAGCDSRETYAHVRRAELGAALQICGQAGCPQLCLGHVDQEASLDLVCLTQDLITIFGRYPEAVVLTHPYEGGHPDHDATAFAVHSAVQLLESGHHFELVEFASYHGLPGWLTVGEFLQESQRPSIRRDFSESERALKWQLLGCFASQAQTLRSFAVGHERFRAAPPYDFTKPPHAGTLHYERFNWGMSGERWRALAGAALLALNLPASQ